MTTLTLRATKGSALTNAEVDANFSALSDDIASRLPAANFSSAGIIAQLGFTPYSSANPSGFITAQGSITGNAATASRVSSQAAADASADRGAGLQLLSSTTGASNFPSALGLTMEARRASGSASDIGSFQLFSANDPTETYSVRKVTGYGGGVDQWSAWRTLWHSGNLTSLSQLANGPGFITGINGAMVSAALGFTPYDAANPAAFITASSSIAGNAATASKLAAAVNINGVPFDGSGAITVADATKLPLAGGSLTGSLGIPAAARFNGTLGYYDTRAVTDVPSSLYGGLRLDFKNAASVGTPPVQAVNGNAHILSVSAWMDSTGGYPMQLSLGDGLAVRQGAGASAWGPWRTVWHNGNLTNVSQLANNASYGSLTQAQVWTAQQKFLSNVGSGVSLGSTANPNMVVYSSDGGAAFMSFLRNGAYAVNMGLDPDNVFRIGGWSAPAGLLALDMSGNLAVKAALQTTGVALSAALSDTVNGSTWYGIGRTSSDMLGGGGTTVQLAGYAGLRLQTSGAYFNLTPSAAGFSCTVGAPRVAVGFDPGVDGAVGASNWFRTTGNTGLYFADFGCGLRAAQGEYGSVGTHGSLGSGGSWQGYSINGGAVFMHDGNTSGNWGIYNDYNNTWMLLSDMSGNATFTGNVTAYSDLRIKRDVAPIRDALKKLLTLTGITFTRTDTGERGIGLGAQHVQRVFPEAVRKTVRDAEGLQEILTVAYGNLVGPIVEALREVDARLSALEAA